MQKPEISFCEMLYEVLLKEGLNDIPPLSFIDKPSGVLRVWSSLIESLSFTCIITTGKYQSQIMDMYFLILRELLTIPG